MRLPRRARIDSLEVKVQYFDDPPCMPGTGETPAALLGRAIPLAGTPGQAYVERRGIPLVVAHAAGVYFDGDFSGRPAVLVALRNQEGVMTSVHGRYLETLRGQDKMLTVGYGGGVVSVLGGWRATPLILVEGLFDALSLATCGLSAIATVGRWAPWLPQIAVHRTAWIAFDANRPGEREAFRYAERLPDADVRRLPPPSRCKDWNTALIKRGPGDLTSWVRDHITTNDTPRP